MFLQTDIYLLTCALQSTQQAKTLRNRLGEKVVFGIMSNMAAQLRKDIQNYSQLTSRSGSQDCEFLSDVEMLDGLSRMCFDIKHANSLTEIEYYCREYARTERLAMMQKHYWDSPLGEGTQVLTRCDTGYYFSGFPGRNDVTTTNPLRCIAAYTARERAVVERAFISAVGASDKPARTLSDLGLEWVPARYVKLAAADARGEDTYLFVDSKQLSVGECNALTWQSWEQYVAAAETASSGGVRQMNLS